ncbi:DUF3307 domain-containing protein [Actinosynnema sp. NPDC051121]
MMQDPTAFLLALAAITPAHLLADHWFQTRHQVEHKGDRSWAGRAACARHALVHVLVAAPFLAAVALVFDSGLSLTGLVAGQVWTAVSHYVIDRRWTVERAARWLTLFGLSVHVFHDVGRPRVHRVMAQRPGYPDATQTVTELVQLDQGCMGTGRYVLDQTAHHAALFIAALITALAS